MPPSRSHQSQAQRDALDRAFRAERRGRILRLIPAVAIAVMLATGYVWFTAGHGEIVERNPKDATVLNWTRPQTYTGTGSLVITVKLASGREVVARSRQSLAPPSGTRTRVQENVYESGHRVFVWPVEQAR